MADIISFDVKLTPNQKKAQDKLNQVHQLYDEIEKLLGTQDVFNKPHLLLVLPNKLKKEPMTNDEWRRTCSTEEFAEFLNLIIRVGPYENEPKDFWEHVYGRGGEYGAKSIVAWLKQPHRG